MTPYRGPAACFRLLLGMLLLAPLGAARAQPLEFGSADDPVEALQRIWWRSEQSLSLGGGLSLIGPQWRAATGFSYTLAARPLTLHLSGAFRAGVDGDYGPDFDEAYDLLRLVDFARYEPSPTSNLYLRAGPLKRLRLGTGHLVDFFSSETAWNERTVGLEAMRGGRYVDVAAFTDNVLVDGVVGGRLAVRPLAAVGNPLWRSLELGFNAVTDLATRADSTEGVTAYNADLQFDVYRTDLLGLGPFASLAWYPEYGQSIALGLDAISENFIDVARVRGRVAFHFNSDKFVSGHIGPFYTVNNPNARILDSESFLGDDPAASIVGTRLEEAQGGVDFVTELRILFFERFEFWYHFRRHYGDQALSQYNLRLFVRSSRALLKFGLDRGGQRSIFGVIGDLEDESALVLEADYQIQGPFWIFVRTRYTYELISTTPGGVERYLVERRFEPMTGLRLNW